VSTGERRGEVALGFKVVIVGRELVRSRLRALHVGLIALAILAPSSPPPASLSLLGIGSRSRAAGAARQVFVGRQELGRFNVGLGFDRPFGPAESLGRSLGAKPRVSGAEAFAPGHVAGFAGPVVRPAAFARKLLGLGSSAAIGLERPLWLGQPRAFDVPVSISRRAARAVNNVAWSRRGKRGRRPGPFRLGRALTAARPDRGPATTSRRPFGPRFLVSGFKFLGEGGRLRFAQGLDRFGELFVQAR
jgi:hypothetical protein